jgi:hypothetical protein
VRWGSSAALVCGLLVAVPALAETKGFDPLAATEAYLATVSPEAKAKSDAYFEGGYWLQLWNVLYGLVVAWVLLRFGLSVRMRALAQRVGGKGKLSPGPLEEFLFFDHPSGRSRILMAMRWKAEHLDK